MGASQHLSEGDRDVSTREVWGIVKLLEKLKSDPSSVSPMVTAMQPSEASLPHSRLRKPEFEVSDNGELTKDAARGGRDC